MTIQRFRDLVKDYGRASGYSQKDLADSLGLHPKVLSRKMSGIGSYQLFHPEIKKIINTLAKWKAISSQEEVNELLSELELKANFFSNEEWQDFPLSELEKTGASSTIAPVLLSAFPGVSQPPSPSLYNSVLYDNLPVQLTSLVGWEPVVARIGELLTLPSTRLLSIIGPGGCGKTRLAIEAGRVFKSKFSQGVCFVNLAEVNDPHWVGAAIFKALGLLKSPISNQVQALKTFLQNQQVLLILDNFEHLTGATSLIEELLKAAPDLKIIVTTRVVLNLYGEKEFVVPALDLPEPEEELDCDSIIKYDAVRLFVERIQAIKPDFWITGDNAWMVAQICQQLNGLPLALELAAARIRMLSLPVLLERLTIQKLDLLSSDANNLPLRQKTLRNTLDWSYKLLTQDEQQFFRMLGIFRGSFSIEAVEALWNGVIGDNTIGTIQTLDRLGALLKESLIIQIEGEEPLYGFVLTTANLVSTSRFKLLETIREYALEQLSVHDELVAFQFARLDYYLELSRNLRNQLNGPDQNLWLNLLDSEYANIRMVLDTSLSLIEAISQAENSRVIFAGLEMCRCLTTYWDTRGYYLEGKISTNNFLVAARQASLTNTKEYAWALSVAGLMAGRLGDFGTAQKILRESYTRFVALGEKAGEAYIHIFQGVFAFLVGNYTQAKQHYLQAEHICYQLDDKTNLGKALISLAILEQTFGNYTLANNLILQGLLIFQEQGNKQMIANCLNNLAVNAQHLQDYVTARNYYYECLQLNNEQSDYRTKANTLRGLASIAISQSDYSDAHSKLGESLRLSHRIGDKFQVGQNLALLAILNVFRFESKLLENALQEETQYLEVAAQLMGGSAAQFNQTQAEIEPLYINLYEEKVQTARNRLGEAEFNLYYLKGLNSSLAPTMGKL